MINILNKGNLNFVHCSHSEVFQCIFSFFVFKKIKSNPPFLYLLLHGGHSRLVISLFVPENSLSHFSYLKFFCFMVSIWETSEF